MGKSGECLALCVLPSSHNCSLSQVVRDDGLLRGVQQGDPCLRDGDAGADQRLPPGVLRLPAVQPQVRDYLIPTSRTCALEIVLFPSLQLTAERRRELPPFLDPAS